MAKAWKKGRGKLGFLEPLIGRWSASAESPMGPVRCTRVFEKVLGGSYVRLDARWQFGAARAKVPGECKATPPKGGAYEEIALFGVDEACRVTFWSFTSDGKRSQGTVADVTDVHPEAIGFEARVPAGLARMIYWPGEDGGFYFAVEAQNKKGWKRFVKHHYSPA
jgi:hypothetical protein